MPAYRFYRNKRANHIGQPPEDLKFPNDAAAVEQAKKLLDGHDIEIWRGALIVAHLDSKD
jgi:hypothetical protein